MRDRKNIDRQNKYTIERRNREMISLLNIIYDAIVLHTKDNHNFKYQELFRENYDNVELISTLTSESTHHNSLLINLIKQPAHTLKLVNKKSLNKEDIDPAKQISSEMFQFVLSLYENKDLKNNLHENIKIGQILKNFLLYKDNLTSANSLQLLLENCDHNTLMRFTKLITPLLGDGKLISMDNYIKWLFSNVTPNENTRRYNSLTTALRYSDDETLTYLFNLIITLIKKYIIPKNVHLADAQKYFLNENNSHVHLDRTLKYRSLSIIKQYFNLLDYAENTNILTKKDFELLVTNVNDHLRHSGQQGQIKPALYTALDRDNHDIGNFYIDFLYKKYTEKKISGEACCTILLLKHSQDFDAFISTLMNSAKLETVELYIRFLSRLYDDKVISSKEILDFYYRSSIISDFTLLHKAAKTNNLQIVTALIDFLEKVTKDSENRLSTIFSSKSNSRLNIANCTTNKNIIIYIERKSRQGETQNNKRRLDITSHDKEKRLRLFENQPHHNIDNQDSRRDSRRDDQHRSSDKRDSRRDDDHRSSDKRDSRRDDPHRSSDKRDSRREDQHRSSDKRDSRRDDPHRSSDKRDSRREDQHRSSDRHDSRRDDHHRSSDRRDDPHRRDDRGDNKRDEQFIEQNRTDQAKRKLENISQNTSYVTNKISESDDNMSKRIKNDRQTNPKNTELNVSLPNQEHSINNLHEINTIPMNDSVIDVSNDNTENNIRIINFHLSNECFYENSSFYENVNVAQEIENINDGDVEYSYLTSEQSLEYETHVSAIQNLLVADDVAINLENTNFLIFKRDILDSVNSEDQIDSSYVSNYVDALLINQDKPEFVAIHRVHTLRDLDIIDPFVQNKIHIIPVHLPLFHEDNRQDNHYGFIVLDLINRRFSYVDSAAQKPCDKIIDFAKLFQINQNQIMHNEHNYQAREMNRKFIRHCGAYAVELIKAAIKAMTQDSKNYDLSKKVDIDIVEARIKHIGQFHNLLSLILDQYNEENNQLENQVHEIEQNTINVQDDEETDSDSRIEASSPNIHDDIIDFDKEDNIFVEQPLENTTNVSSDSNILNTIDIQDNEIFKVTNRNFAPNEITVRQIKQFDIHAENDIKALEESANYQYQFDMQYDISRGITPPKLLITPIYAIENEYGIIANQDIPAGHVIACYAGVRRIVKHNTMKSSERDSGYTFALHNEKNEVIGEIDALTVRNCAPFVNHSNNPNVHVQQENIDGLLEIVYYSEGIKKGDQIVFDYGNDYFYNLKDDQDFKPRYLNKTSNAYSPAEVYQINKQAYAIGLFSLNDDMVKALELHSNTFIFTKLILAMLKNDLNEFKNLLKSSDPNLPLLSVIDNKICDIKEQQNITALHIACYLGKETYIRLLLRNNAIGDFCALHSGYTPLMALIKGKGEPEVKDKLACEMLDQAEIILFPFSLDNMELGILHYAIQFNRPKIVEKIFDVAKLININLFDRMFQKPRKNEILGKHLAFDDCLRSSKFNMLKILLNNINSKTLVEKIMLKQVFKADTINRLSLENLIKFFKMLQQSPHTSVLRQFIIDLKQTIRSKQINATKPITPSNTKQTSMPVNNTQRVAQRVVNNNQIEIAPSSTDKLNSSYYVDEYYIPRVKEQKTKLSLNTICSHLKYWLKINEENQEECKVKITITQNKDHFPKVEDGYVHCIEKSTLLKKIKEANISEETKKRLLTKATKYLDKHREFWFDENNQLVLDKITDKPVASSTKLEKPYVKKTLFKFSDDLTKIRKEQKNKQNIQNERGNTQITRPIPTVMPPTKVKEIIKEVPKKVNVDHVIKQPVKKMPDKNRLFSKTVTKKEIRNLKQFKK